MDKNSIKKYAVWARRELISRVSQRALLYGISEKDCGDLTADTVNGHLLTASEKRQRQSLIVKIKKDGYQQAMEAAAYTWFNRFSALRFMEVNGYLPSHVRVFTDEDNNFKPQILAEAIHLDIDGLDMEKVYEMKDANKTDELYKYLLITQCNALGAVLPGMFTRIEDYTELLFPDNLLREGSVIEQMIALIPQEDWTDQVQIIGWLYQYYNAEPKDKVFENLKKNIKISKENIPAATQLFTPDWIVRYMVENSLGRLWVEGHPNEELKANWKYYLEEAEQEPDVQKQLAEIRKEYAALKPEDIRCIDPCMGSGHILVYMFDVLIQIYEAYGYNTREAAALILQNNLYGLDIDDRASQLAYFAVMMKARQYDRRIFSRGIQPHVYAIVESNDINSNTIEYFVDGRADLKKALESILTELHDAKEYGSILNVTPVDFAALYARFDEISEDIHIWKDAALNELKPLVYVAEMLAQKYDAVATNPPYMGAANMNPKLNDFIKTNYADYKSDFFSAFVIHASQMAKVNGYCGFLTPYVWMFIQSYEKMRNYLYHNATIETLIQFEYSAFEEATVPICTFAFRNGHTAKKGCYLRLTDFRGGMEVQREKTSEAIANHDCGFYYEQSTDNFEKIPGCPVAYWVSPKIITLFSREKIGDYFSARVGLMTTDNDRFLRFFWEVNVSDICFNATNSEQALFSEKKWFPHNKGGAYRKWAGNREYIVNWKNNGEEIKQTAIKKYPYLKGNPNFVVHDDGYYFKESISWSEITSSTLSFRYFPEGFTFNVKGMSAFPNSEYSILALLGYINSNLIAYLVKIINPTISFGVNNFENLPFVYGGENVENIAAQNIILAKNDWDAFETSWDFNHHPLIYRINTISEAYQKWEIECNERFYNLKSGEEELNRIFIDIYGLQDELTPEVEDKDVTVRKADLQRDIKSLISYAVGCMFGRYSLDVDGLAYAGGDWDASKYATFPADKDNIIPICDDEYFDDDIVARFVQFIETVYGKDTLEENLRFIADALGGKGASRDVIRDYFLNGFYADHLKIYQKRPIYWLFDSGKKGGFKALIYMHRYREDTIARIRTDYVHEQQARYRTAIADLENRIAGASTSERVKLNKQLQKLQGQATEIHDYEEKIHHLADQMIRIDLDDGVKHNYELFSDVLAKIK